MYTCLPTHSIHTDLPCCLGGFWVCLGKILRIHFTKLDE